MPWSDKRQRARKSINWLHQQRHFKTKKKYKILSKIIKIGHFISFHCQYNKCTLNFEFQNHKNQKLFILKSFRNSTKKTHRISRPSSFNFLPVTAYAHTHIYPHNSALIFSHTPRAYKSSGKRNWFAGKKKKKWRGNKQVRKIMRFTLYNSAGSVRSAHRRVVFWLLRACAGV